MWIDRQGNWTGNEAPSYVQSTTAYRTENGKDVVYVTGDQGASGFPSLYRYTLGDVRNGGQDTWEKIGITNNTVGYQGVGTLDTEHNLYIRTATVAGRYTSDLAIWDLDKANAANPGSNVDIGINLVKVKLLAYTLGAGFAGVAGAIFAVMLGSVFPHSFQLLISINVLALIILGGLGSLPGVVIGALALIGIPELLREFGEYRYLFYGVVLILMMRVRPEGLWPAAVRRRELRANGR